MIGLLPGHYRISSQIGEERMGVVYRPHDDVLHRDVSMKVLGKSLTSDGSAKDSLLPASLVRH